MGDVFVPCVNCGWTVNDKTWTDHEHVDRSVRQTGEEARALPVKCSCGRSLRDEQLSCECGASRVPDADLVSIRRAIERSLKARDEYVQRMMDSGE